MESVRQNYFYLKMGSYLLLACKLGHLTKEKYFHLLQIIQLSEGNLVYIIVNE